MMSTRKREQIREHLIDAVARAADVDRSSIDTSRAFRDFGLTSSQAVSLSGELEDWLERPLSPTLLYEHPTIDALAATLAGEAPPPAAATARDRAHHSDDQGGEDPGGDDPVCVVGLGCRFPGGGDDPERFWTQLLAGVDAGREVPSDRWDVEAFFDPNPGAAGKSYTKRGGFLDDIAGFDAGLFGISPGEAMRMDPQQRLLLEIAWSAVEHAGIAPDRLAGSRTGVFVGMMGSQEYGRLETDGEGDRCFDDPFFGYGIAPSVAAGRLSYTLDLHGPSLCVDTACSSSLVCVHLARESLQRRQCDLAIAVGVSAILHPAGMVQACHAHMLSADGRCKTFDEQADGFMIGEGCGAVVLERASDALARGHRIFAVLRGSAVNQDGRTNGPTAPSKDAQARVIREAIATAGVTPAEIDYVEAHGSGTQLGDAIELSALQEVFGEERDPNRPLLVGAVKTNVGHLLGAAGVAGLIKAVLAVHSGRIPANVHFSKPTSAFDWGRAPISIPRETLQWTAREPRLAGVSSFGWSGTNAHLVLESWSDERRPDSRTYERRPERRTDERRPRTSTAIHVVPLSARTDTALATAAESLAARVDQTPDGELADVAYTQQLGRAALEWRAAAVCGGSVEAAAMVRELAHPGAATYVPSGTAARPVFLFPGTGDQYPGMGSELYNSERIFRDAFDACAEAAAQALEADLRHVVYSNEQPSDGTLSGTTRDLAAMLGRGAARGQGEDPLARTDLTHCALFAVEYALARLLQSWGVEPAAMLGYSLGEYVAATLAGVFELHDALGLIARRAQLLTTLPPGAMLAVAQRASDLEGLLGRGAWLAATNGPGMSVVAGSLGSIAGLEHELERRGIAHQRVNAAHALHSGELEPIRERLETLIESFPRGRPTIPFVSCATGTWITERQACDPAYWAAQIISPVRFDAGLESVSAAAGTVLLEVGPGQTLTSLARQVPREEGCGELSAVPTLRSALAGTGGGDREHLLRAVAAYWTHGGAVRWARLHEPGSRRVVSVPGYPYEHRRYWPDARPSGSAQVESDGNRPDLADWGYLPVWKQSEPVAPAVGGLVGEQQPPAAAGPAGDGQPRWLVFSDGSDLVAAVSEQLRATGAQIVTVRPDHEPDLTGPGAHVVRPASLDDHEQLLAELDECGRFPTHVLHAFALASACAAPGTEQAGAEQAGAEMVGCVAAQDRSFFSLLATVRAVGRRAAGRTVRVVALAGGLHDVLGDEPVEPIKATAIGVCRTAPQEFPTVACRSVEVAAADLRRAPRPLADRLVHEITTDTSEAVIALRGRRRWAQVLEPARLEPTAPERVWRADGVYLITGGFGELGLALARGLAARGPARLCLLARTPLPPREQWEQQLGDADVRRRIEAVLELERLGAQVLVLSADVADVAEARGAVACVLARFGALHGVVHAAGAPASGLIALKTYDEARTVLRPKVAGTLALHHALRDVPLDFFVVYSSAVVAHGGLGESDYCAANCFVDAFARRSRAGGAPVTAVDWGPWRRDAWSAASGGPARELRERYGIRDEQGLELLTRILAGGAPQVLVAQQEPERLAARWSQLTLPTPAPAEAGQRHPRPSLRVPYRAPRTELERRIVDIWCQYLGLERVGVDDQFFELGGTSLIGLTIVGQLERELAIVLSAADLFAAPTPGSLAALVAERRDGPNDERPAGARGEQRRKLASAAAARRAAHHRGAVR